MTDTIAAISTPTGKGGIAVLRVSGPDAIAVVAPYVGQQKFAANTARFATFRADDRIIDEVVITTFRAPHSFTGEDVVEISCHGSLFVQEELLRCLLNGSPKARLAKPGEFTLRAFLNGKYDLSQAEAVADLIDSTSEASHRLAVNQLRGGFSQRLKSIRERFVELTSLLELELDFSDEDVEFADRSALRTIVDELESEISQLVESFRLGNALKNGVPVAIVGRPNVGKSTLLNALLGEERAIVSPIAGTTRDTVEDTLTLGGVMFRFIDTAGLRHSDDQIEAKGIERSYKALREAQVVIHLFEEESVENEILDCEELDRKTLIRVRNKVDVQPAIQEEGVLQISAKQGIGLDSLKQVLVDSVKVDGDQTLLTNVRHQESMKHILEALSHVRDGLLQNLPADLVVIDIRDALYSLGEITGQVTSDEVLGTIFGRFCIGK